MFGGEKKKSILTNKRIRIALIVSACVLTAALITGVLLLVLNGKTQDAMDDTVTGSVFVNGVDISGMTKAEAAAATAHIPDELLDTYQCKLDIGGEIYTFTADDFGVGTDYEEILTQAVSETSSSSQTFTVSLTIDEVAVRGALAELNQTIEQAPKNAEVVFAPSGYTEDGTLYEPDPKELADAHAVGDELERPELVRRDEADMPDKLRYLFWNEDDYDEDNVPVDADIMRFMYTEDVDGLTIDVDAAVAQIQNALESGDFSTITVQLEVAEAEVTVEDLKEDTQLIASWTSSYRDHSERERNWNVSRMSSFVNDTIILPGEKWSINKTAGPRNATTARDIGWKKAAGLYQGATTQQYGGGVCQLGSTTYNAALRADLTIVEFTHHSDPSGYIPKGLDATLDYVSENANGKDLVLGNDGETPVYLVSYVDPKKKTVTVEVYGRLPYNEEYGQQVIYDYTSDNKGKRYGSGRMFTIEAKKTPKGDALSPERPKIVFSKPRAGYKVEVYKHIYALDGTKLENTLLRVSVYKPINGYTYVYPANLMPSPSPTGPSPSPTDPTTSPTTKPTTKPTTEPTTKPTATDPPATDPPATDPPATDPPATDPPATDPPATDPPATDPPTPS